MWEIDNIKYKLDTDNQKWVISEKEFNDNFSKLNEDDYKNISEWLKNSEKEIFELLQAPLFDYIQSKNTLTKNTLNIKELQIAKLFFLSFWYDWNNSSERKKTIKQKEIEDYMRYNNIFFKFWQNWWEEFKKTFKGSFLNISKEWKDISYHLWPINTNNPDLKRLNTEWLKTTIQVKEEIRNKQVKINNNIKNIEKNEVKTRTLSQKLEKLKNDNSIYALDELTSAPNWILYNDNIKEMTNNEQQKIQKIIENVFSNPSINSTQVMNYVWKFHSSLSDEKWSNKTWKKIEWSSLSILVDNQVGMRIEIINTCYQLAQAKWFGELQTKPETAKKNLVKLCNILTWRFNSTGKGRMLQEEDDKKFNNPELARGILENLMQINGTIDKISPVDILKDNPSLKNQECGIFVTEISQNIPRPLSWEFGILDLVSVDETTKISQLSPTLQARAIVLKKISEKIKSDNKQIPFESDYVQKLKNFWTNLAKEQQAKFEIQKEKFNEEIKKAGWYTTSGFEKSAQEYGLQWADTDIFNLYRDFAVNSFWAGQLSDEVDDQVMWYAKMWAMIWWTIVTMMIFPPAWVWYLWSAIAVWVTSTVLTQVLYQKMNYNSFSEWALDIWSQFVFDTATAFLGMKVFWPIIQKVPWFFNNVKNITSNVWVTLFDVTLWSTAEGIRQIGVNELFDRQQEVDIFQMIRAWWVMATVFLMVSGWFHAKLPIDDMLKHLRANDPKTNPTWFKNLNITEYNYNQSLNLLELKSKKLSNNKPEIIQNKNWKNWIWNQDNIQNKTEYNAYIQDIFDQKFKLDQVQIPIKNGKCEYHFFDANWKEIYIDPKAESGSIYHDMTIQTFKKSVNEDVDMWWNSIYTLKTPYWFSKDTKIPWDMDYATNAKWMKNFLYNLKQKSWQIKNFELTGNIDQKIKIEWISSINDLFTLNGKIKPEIENMIDNWMSNGQKVRISYDYLVDIDVSNQNVKWAINRELFVEDWTKFYEVDPTKSIEINVGWSSIKMLTPDWYMKYSEELFMSDFKKDIWSGLDKFKIAKRISDYTDAFTKLPKSKNSNIFQRMLDYIKIPLVKLQVNKAKRNICLEWLEETIRQRKLNNPDDPVIKWLEDVLEFTKRVSKEHQEISKGKKELPTNIWDFMSKTGKVKQTVLKYKKVKEVLDNSELLKNQEYKEKFTRDPIFTEYVKKITKLNENDLTNIDNKHLTQVQQREKQIQIETIEETKLIIMWDPIKLKKFSEDLEINYKNSMEELNSYDYSWDHGFAYYFDYYIIKNADKYRI